MMEQQKMRLFEKCFGHAEAMRDTDVHEDAYKEAKGAYWAMREVFCALEIIDEYMTFEAEGIKEYLKK